MDEDCKRKIEEARVWEKRVARWARVRGWYVLPTYDFSGKEDDKAPKLLGPDGKCSLVLPDLQCFRRGRARRWLEVKTKASASWYGVGGYLTTGISLRLWKHYLDVQTVTGIPVWVLFVHKKEQEMRADSADNLKAYSSHEYTGTKMGPHGMIFWPYEKVPSLGPISALYGEDDKAAPTPEQAPAGQGDLFS